MPSSLQHIAFIMDGNGRWAKQHERSRLEGHKEGAKRAFEVATHTFNRWKVPFLTFYAFSTENWKRSKLEVNGIFRLLAHFLQKERQRFLNERIRLHTIGDTTMLPKRVQTLLLELKKETSPFSEKNLILALNYGAREEVLRAVQRYIELNGEQVMAKKLDWKNFASFLDTVGIPDPDLIVRTSGELRLSNYLLLQSAYSEFYFTQTYWPDFGPSAVDKAIESYLSRERRFGQRKLEKK